MKQLLLRKGTISVSDVPAPALGARHVLVEVSKSLISTGTELSSIQLSGSSLLNKAKQRPKEVKKVLDPIRVRGLQKTFALVQGKLDESRALGYSCVGHVIAVGKEVTNFKAGDRVACAGAKFANHAEVVSVPQNLVVKVPASLTDSQAASVTLGTIALQGLRRADLRVGETAAVIGLGLIGQLAVQILKASGCQVLGLDFDASRVALAEKKGLTQGATTPAELAKQVEQATGGVGVDATLLTASTPNSDPTRQAFEITRKKGKIVVVGAVGMDLERSPFYEKEQDFLISCAYGPGRYDPVYEDQGHDYPLPYVRWTENRNMGAYLSLLDQGKIDLSGIVEKEFSIEKAAEAYETLNQKSQSKPLGILLSYPAPNGHKKESQTHVAVSGPVAGTGRIRLGLIGVGNFTKSMHLPHLQKLSSQNDITAVCTSQSATAASVGRQLKAGLITTDVQEVLKSPDVDAVVVATRHNNHAQIAEQALLHNKHIYLEKPLALELDELNRLNKVVQDKKEIPVFLVGFNRRFAPMTLKLKEALSKRVTPLIASFRVNAGALPLDHWTKTSEGGGRLRGEACHMVDFFQALVGSHLKQISIQGVAAQNAEHVRSDENFNAQFVYDDGSVCTLVYTSLGHKSLSKEWVECHWDGNSAVIDDFQSLTIHGHPALKITSAQDKGHLNAMRTFLDAIQNRKSFPIPWSTLMETTQATIELDHSLAGRLLA